MPQTSYNFICTSTGSSLTPLKNATSLGVPSGPALGAGAVVAVDVDDQRVVEPAQVLEGLDHAADLVVVVGGVGGEDLDLPDEELLLLRAELVPGLQDVIGPGRQLRILGDHAERLLVLEDALAQLVRSRRRTGAWRWILSTHSLVG